MKTEQEIRDRITRITEGSKHVLDVPCANVVINAPRALMQLSATSTLNELYWALGEERPKFKCNEPVG